MLAIKTAVLALAALVRAEEITVPEIHG